MRRYVKGKRFWEIRYDREAFALETTEGTIGKPGKATRLKFRVGHKASAEYHRLVELKVKGKWQPAQPGEPTDPALEAAITAAPDELANYLVYGDWLQAREHPRGALVAVHTALAKLPAGKPVKPINTYHPPVASWPWLQPTRASGAKRLHGDEARLLAQHSFELLGCLADEFGGNGDRIRIEWCAGFIRALRFDLGGASGQRLAAITTLLAHPSARFLRCLSIGELYDDGIGSKALAAIAGCLAPTLRALYLGDFQIGSPEISWVGIGDLSPFYRAAPHLETLLVQGADIGLGKSVELPQLRHLEIRTGGLQGASVRAIGASRLPELETLVVWLGDPERGADSTLADLRGILDGKGLPKLRHLGLMNGEYSDEIAAALPRSRIAKQLRVLDLSMSSLSDDGARALAKLPRLDRLDVSDSYLTAAGVKAVQGLAKTVVAGDQREPYDWDEDKRHYASIGE